MKIDKIMVPTDFSEASAHALDTAIYYGKTFDAELFLLHAYEIPVQLGIGEPVPLPQAYFEQLRERARQQLDERIQKVKAAGLRVSGDLIQESPSYAIPKIAEKEGVDLIIMATHGRTGFKHIVLGSVAERTVRLAPCPVLTVRQPESADGE